MPRFMHRPDPPLRALLLAILACVWSPFPAHAEPVWRADLNSPSAGSHPAIRPTTLEYTLSWKGTLDAGSLLMQFDPRDAKKPGRHVIKSTARSTGAAAKLFPYSHHFWAEVERGSIKPVFFQGNETDRRETITSTVRYFSDRVESREREVARRGGRSVSREVTFHHRDVHNLFSAMLHIRSQKLNAGQNLTILCQPFDNPYLIDVRSHGVEAHNGRNTIRCTVSMRKIDRDTLELREYKKLRRPATLWLSNDADRVIVELRAAVFIGDVRATLVRQTKP